VNLKLPVALESVLNMLSNTTASAALFTMGVFIAHRKAIINSIEIPSLILFKLNLYPLCVYLFLSWLGPFDKTWI